MGVPASPRGQEAHPQWPQEQPASLFVVSMWTYTQEQWEDIQEKFQAADRSVEEPGDPLESRAARARRQNAARAALRRAVYAMTPEEEQAMEQYTDISEWVWTLQGDELAARGIQSGSGESLHRYLCSVLQERDLLWCDEFNDKLHEKWNVVVRSLRTRDTAHIRVVQAESSRVKELFQEEQDTRRCVAELAEQLLQNLQESCRGSRPAVSPLRDSDKLLEECIRDLTDEKLLHQVAEFVVEQGSRAEQRAWERDTGSARARRPRRGKRAVAGSQ